MRSPFRLGPWRVDPDRLTVARDERHELLEPKTMEVLLALAERPGEVLSADELIEVVWEGRAMGDNPVYGAIAKLRRALDDDARNPRYIETIARRGYRLAVAPEPVEEGAVASSETAKPSVTPRLAVGGVLVFLLLAAVWWNLGQQGDPAAAPPPASTPSARAIAVLPFVNVSGNADYDLFGTGFSEDVLDLLARIEALRVMARTSSFAFGGDPPQATDLASRLAVDYLLMGTVHPENGRLRVSARLLDAEGRQIWGDSYDRALADTLEVRSEVARSIARLLALTLEQSRSGERVVSVEALQSYLAGREYTRLGLVRHADEAVRSYRRAIELEPDYADAHAGLARVLAHEGDTAGAREFADRALSLDPGAAEAHLTLGLLATRQRSSDGAATAIDHFRQATRLHPSLTEAQHYLAATLDTAGRWQEAFDVRQAAIERDPFHYGLNRALAREFSERGELPRAIGLLRKVREWPNPDQPALLDLGQVLWSWSRHAELVQEITRQERLPGPLRSSALAVTANSFGRLGLFDAATSSYEQARSASSWPDRGLAFVLRADYLAATGQWAALEEEVLALEGDRPGSAGPHVSWMKGSALVRQGRFEEGVAVLEPALRDRFELREDFAVLEAMQFLALAWRETGQAERASARLVELRAQFEARARAGLGRRPSDLAALARLHAIEGDGDRALELLANALRSGWVGYYELGGDPRWAGVRDHPDFEARLDQARAVVERQQALLSAPSVVG